jgi:hypothetical protein
MKSSILGAISVVVYGIVARYAFIPLGLIAGTATSILISFGGSYLIYRYMARRTS